MVFELFISDVEVVQASFRYASFIKDSASLPSKSVQSFNSIISCLTGIISESLSPPDNLLLSSFGVEGRSARIDCGSEDNLGRFGLTLGGSFPS